MTPAKKMAAIEKELDLIWPRWRARPSIKALPANYQARIKWLLKRLSLLSSVTEGVPTPRDWPVQIIVRQARGGGGPTKIYAHVHVPDGSGVAFSDALLQGPPKVDTSLLQASESASQIAARIRVPLETVEDLLPNVPSGEDAGAWILAQVRVAKAAARSKARSKASNEEGK